MGGAVADAILIAGANGAGKTTFARQFLQVQYPGGAFLNADEIQREDSRFAHPVAAGRELLRRMTGVETAGVTYAVDRVARRVAAGGHSVPEADIRRRFHRGLQLFETVFKPLPDRWYHWLSDDGGLRLVDQDQNRS